jgi:protein-tyrosine phosphatase
MESGNEQDRDQVAGHGSGMRWSRCDVGRMGVAAAVASRAFCMVALAHFGAGARVFGKGPAGRLGVMACLAMGPYLGLSYFLWWMNACTSREACCHEVVPGIWLGRRPGASEVPTGVRVVADLTAEFHEGTHVRNGRRYMCVPVLDTGVPADEALALLIDDLAREEGPLYVHCASGHGRPAMVVAAVLVRRGMVRTVEEAEALIRKVWPRVRLGKCQRAALDRVLEPSAGAGAI